MRISGITLCYNIVGAEYTVGAEANPPVLLLAGWDIVEERIETELVAIVAKPSVVVAVVETGNGRCLRL